MPRRLPLLIKSLFWVAFAILAGVAVAYGAVSLTGTIFSPRATTSLLYDINGTSTVTGLSQATVLGGLDILVPTKGKVIVADLAKKQIQLLENGLEVDTLPIISIGRPGSAWETPTGLYRVISQEDKHFSSIGGVWMPWSIQFFGNFFIHGWPTYPGGKPVAEGYSGGCIRLKTEDAERVYKFADTKTKVAIKNGSAITATTSPSYWWYKSTKLPKISAKSFLVADAETGEILLERNKNVVYPIASITKLMTALVSLETINQFQVTVVSPSAMKTYGQAGNLKLGERLEVKNLIYPLLLESSNRTAEVLAEHAGRDRFIRNMNERAESMGLTQTSFLDPSGLSPSNVSTADDLFKLTRYLFENKKYVLEVTRQKSFKLENHTWFNSNRLARFSNYLGGKNGYTDQARKTQVAVFSMPLGEFEERPIAIIVLKSEDKDGDIRAILNYLSANVYYGPRPKQLTEELRARASPQS